MLDLFSDTLNPHQNILPYQGEVFYFGKIFSELETKKHFESLRQGILWQNDLVKMYGKTIECKRQTAWMGEQPFEYKYSGVIKTALQFNPEMQELKTKVESVCGHPFNSCLLNFYKDGNEGMSWHSDNEKTMGQKPIIASLSLGASRKFSFKHNDNKEKIDIILENGSLLIMQGDTQNYWKHSLPIAKKISSPRINLTFRNFVAQ